MKQLVKAENVARIGSQHAWESQWLSGVSMRADAKRYGTRAQRRVNKLACYDVD